MTAAHKWRDKIFPLQEDHHLPLATIPDMYSQILMQHVLPTTFTLLHNLYAQCHNWHFLTSFFSQDLSFKAKSVSAHAHDSWSTCLLSLWAKTAFSTDLSKKTNESNNYPLAPLFTWIQIRKVYHISKREGTLPLPVHWTLSQGKTPSSTRTSFFPLDKGFFVKWCNTKDQAYIKTIYPSMAATLTASNTTPLDQMILNNSCINS